MADLEPVWCVRGYDETWHATKTGRMPHAADHFSRATCGKRVFIKMLDEHPRVPDCLECVLLLARDRVKAQQATDSEDNVLF